jgi:hypothetical protein
MRILRIVVVLTVCTSVALLAAACGNPPKVVQGIVAKYDPASHTLVLKDEKQPEQELVFSLEGAEIGAEPVEQDEVRLAYREEGGRLVATRVMNLTRQKEIGKQK